jgi:DMSO/TMAO reductase YedYZ molybdopterin-dependent catalytic subunit
MTLPPGQRAVDGFPRFGTHFHHPPPEVPAEPVIEIKGAVREPFTVPVAELAALPRRELEADFHCVSGWSATNLRWEGVPFSTFYRRLVEPALEPGAVVSHIGFGGLDGYRSIATIGDVLSDDVILAENLNGRPLDGDHGAPLRLVSPNQYGFISTKHLCRIDLETSEPQPGYHPSALIRGGLGLVKPHERARVWEEERHRHLPASVVRPVYRLLIPPFKFLAARGGVRRK